MTGPGLGDDPARTAIRSTLTSSFFVEAGAGTGKTTELVNRIVALVATGGVDIRRIVAITFTEAAAGELRERIRFQLAAVRDEHGAHSERGSACARALDGIDEAAIQTIHAFARRLLQSHPTEVGLPPVFEVLDAMQARLAFKRRFAEFLGQTLSSGVGLDSGVEDVLRTAMLLGLEARHFRALAERLEAHWDRLETGLAVMPAAAPPPLEGSSVVAALDAALAHTARCTNADDPLLKVLEGDVRNWRDRLVAASASNDAHAMLRLVARGPEAWPSKTGGRKENWGGTTGVAEARQAVAAARQAVDAYLDAVQTWAFDGVFRLVAGFVLRSVEQRRRAGALEFHDLLVFARDLLRDGDDVRAAVRERYPYVFVDEFQDTDPLQAEIVRLLTHDGAGRPAAGPLLVVGDPKQSIYRFRGADLRQYESFRSVMDESDVLSLHSNFRTLPGVVEWINTVFEGVLGGHAATRWQPLAVGREAASSGSVTLIGDVAPKGTLRAAELREVEAAELVATIRSAREEKWGVQERSGRLRAARYGDIAVLMPTRVVLPALERALRLAEIPYRVESRSLIWSTQEIRDVLSILEALDEPTNSVAVVAALRSPAFACSDRDLLDWHHAGGSWNYLAVRPSGTAGSRISAAFDALSSLHDQRWWRPVPELVSEVIASRQMFETAFARSRQREAWNRLRFLSDRARAWTEEGGASLRAFLDWAQEQTAEGADALESVVPEADDDAVRLMTVHASKGLEFPIVCVTGLNAKRTNSDSVRVLWSDAGRPELSIGGDIAWATSGFSGIRTADDDDERAEQSRLLYVAATRARDHLIVSVHRSEDVDCLAKTLADAAVGVPIPGPPETVAGDDEFAEVPLSGHEVGVAANARRVAAVRAGTVPVSFSATKVRSLVAGDDEEFLPRRTAAPTDLAADDLAERLAFGSAVHAVLETIDFARPGDVASAARAIAEPENLGHRVDDIVRSVGLALESRPIREAIASGRYWREVYVGNAVDETAVEGFVDLLYERDDGFVVIDYKTDALAGADSAGELAEHYRWQLVTYAAVLERTLGRPVVEAALLLVSPSNEAAVVAPVVDLAAAKAAFDARIAALTAR